MPPDALVAPLTQRDIENAVSLLKELRASFGGIEGCALYRALCGSKSVLVVVAHDEGSFAGIAVVELDRSWIYKHPLLAACMLARRLRRRSYALPAATSPMERPATKGMIREGPCPVSWGAREPRIVFIGVRAGNRGRGLGSALYTEVFRQLERLGHRNLLARIDPDNIASILLHARTGWEIYWHSGTLTALKRLNSV